jgi:hypothetical protein
LTLSLEIIKALKTLQIKVIGPSGQQDMWPWQVNAPKTEKGVAVLTRSGKNPSPQEEMMFNGLLLGGVSPHYEEMTSEWVKATFSPSTVVVLVSYKD